MTREELKEMIAKEGFEKKLDELIEASIPFSKHHGYDEVMKGKIKKLKNALSELGL